MSRSKLALAFGSVLGGTIVGLLVMDEVAGAWNAGRDVEGKAAVMEHPELSWTNRPGFANEKVSINAHGLRGPEIPTDASPTEVRVLGCGASRCFGAGTRMPANDELWSAHLEHFLGRRAPGTEWRVLNGGVVGYSALQAARRAQMLLDVVEPDLVVLFLSGSAQMMIDVSSSSLWVRTGDTLVPSDIAHAVPPRFLPAAARAHDWLGRFELYKRYRADVAFADRRPKGIDGYVLGTQPARKPAIDRMVERTFWELGALAHAARQRGIEVRALLLAEAFQLDDERWPRYLRQKADAAGPPPGTPRLDSIDALALRLQPKPLGIRCWNFVPEQSRMHANRAKYLADHSHWTNEGHALVAGGMLARIEQDGLLKELPRRRAARPRKAP